MNPAEYVYSDVEFQRGVERRNRRIVLTANALYAIVLCGWLAYSWLAHMPVVTVACIGGLVLAVVVAHLQFRSQDRRATWLLLASLPGMVLVMLPLEGVPGPGGAAAHIWLLSFAMGSQLVLVNGDRLPRIAYMLACVAGFLVVEFGLVRIEGAAPLAPDVTAIARSANLAISAIMIAVIVNVFIGDLLRLEAKLRGANDQLEEIIGNMLPKVISDRLRREGRSFADSIDQCSVLFADIVGFTSFANGRAPMDLVTTLNDIFTRFDELIEKAGLEKIKTIGDAYMVASGIPLPRADHAHAVADFALAIREVMADFAPLQIRIGINSGEVVAGIIGKKKFIYDLWGDAVNIASRMESHGIPGEIQVSAGTYGLLKDDFAFEALEDIQVKGKGRMRVYLLKGRSNPAEPRAPKVEQGPHSGGIDGSGFH